MNCKPHQNSTYPLEGTVESRAYSGKEPSHVPSSEKAEQTMMYLVRRIPRGSDYDD